MKDSRGQSSFCLNPHVHAPPYWYLLTVGGKHAMIMLMLQLLVDFYFCFDTPCARWLCVTKYIWGMPFSGWYWSVIRSLIFNSSCVHVFMHGHMHANVEQRLIMKLCPCLDTYLTLCLCHIICTIFRICMCPHIVSCWLDVSIFMEWHNFFYVIFIQDHFLLSLDGSPVDTYGGQHLLFRHFFIFMTE